MTMTGRPETYDVAVIGLGAMGSASLYQLARRGVKVVGIDRLWPPHDQGSTHGETRITRQAVGEGEAYVPLVLRAHEIWRELEEETGEKLLTQCGCLIVGSGDGAVGSRRAAFFTTANASGKISSSFFHCSSSCGIFETSSAQAAVLPRNSSSDKLLNCSSSSLIRRTVGESRLSSR
jgi:hypothetical protein